ncbi:hypothetical protein B0T26DRAFT_411375 [Lasiosphaeria miniovina]|uniref:Secreted protein n=1 Tax=Lasiosphaeria miniovina TaxID=1954250 RepID=A0AA40A5D3_9PEZI|nr:uncharacterized protein B0T26DRAFT_411375 [Lasiosphaeria miniovina]KAK0709562.1 hypothetical protein B0T26DRAFT_411375 [Lasiosphaeria miniovina]
MLWLALTLEATCVSTGVENPGRQKVNQSIDQSINHGRSFTFSEWHVATPVHKVRSNCQMRPALRISTASWRTALSSQHTHTFHPNNGEPSRAYVLKTSHTRQDHQPPLYKRTEELPQCLSSHHPSCHRMPTTAARVTAPFTTLPIIETTRRSSADHTTPSLQLAYRSVARMVAYTWAMCRSNRTR